MDLRIKELCKEKGIRMSDIAEKMGVNQANLASSLNGNPTLSRLQDVAKVLGVETYELFVKPSDFRNGLNGFIEINENVSKISTEEDLIKAVKATGTIPEPFLYLKISDLRKDIASYVHEMIKEYDSGRLLSGRLGCLEMFTLSCTEEILQDSEEETHNYIFCLCLVRKNIVIQYQTLEYGYDDIDIDGEQGLIQNVINDLEWPLESCESACEFGD